jgi:hypothetical protein
MKPIQLLVIFLIACGTTPNEERAQRTENLQIDSVKLESMLAEQPPQVEIEETVERTIPTQQHCSSEVCLYVTLNFDKLTRDDLSLFLQSFHPSCISNAEFTEWSNELLFRILNAYPETIIELLESEELERKNIISTLESPINDAIPVQPLIDKIKRLQISTTTSKDVINALETALTNY